MTNSDEAGKSSGPGTELSPDQHIRLARTLQDLTDFIELAKEVTSRTRAAYDADVTLRLAGEAIVIRVGEAVNRLPNEFTRLHPEVPWRSIKGARNVTSHDYHRIDPRVMWESLNRDLPELGRLLGLQVRPDDDVGGADDQRTISSQRT